MAPQGGISLAWAYGGAICAQSSIVNLTDTKFIENSAFVNATSCATARGGAVYQYDAEASISRAVFERNCVGAFATRYSAYAEGGAVYAQASAVNLTDAVFVGNSAWANVSRDP